MDHSLHNGLSDHRYCINSWIYRCEVTATMTTEGKEASIITATKNLVYGLEKITNTKPKKKYLLGKNITQW